MASRQGERFSQFVAPFGFGLHWPRVDQIEAHALKILGGDLKCLPRFGCGVQPPQKAQLLIGERLHPERNAVDACGAVARETSGFDTGRIGLQRDLTCAFDWPKPRDRTKECANSLRRHERRVCRLRRRCSK